MAGAISISVIEPRKHGATMKGTKGSGETRSIEGGDKASMGGSIGRRTHGTYLSQAGSHDEFRVVRGVVEPIFSSLR